MGSKLKDLAGLKLMYPVARTKLRKVRPSKWAEEGLELPASGKWASFWITHTDLATWAGGLKGMQKRFDYSEDVQSYLWGLFEREVMRVHDFFDEVMEPDPTRLMDWCDNHFESRSFLPETTEFQAK